MNDRVAIELGRAIVRALVAEERLAAAQARIEELETAAATADGDGPIAERSSE